MKTTAICRLHLYRRSKIVILITNAFQTCCSLINIDLVIQLSCQSVGLKQLQRDEKFMENFVDLQFAGAHERLFD